MTEALNIIFEIGSVVLLTALLTVLIVVNLTKKNRDFKQLNK